MLKHLQNLEWMLLPLIRSAATRKSADQAQLAAAVPVFDLLAQRAAAAGAAIAADELELPFEPQFDEARWRICRITAEMLAAHYAARSEILTVDALKSSFASVRSAIWPETDGTFETEHYDDLEALASAAATIVKFPFGHEPASLMSEVVERLRQAVGAVAPQPGAEADGDYRRLFVAAAAIYADAHQTEQRELMERSPFQRNPRRPLPLDGVWKRFEASFGLMMVLVRASEPIPAPAVENP